MHEYLLKKEFANCVITEWNLKNIMFHCYCFLWSKEGDTIASLNKTTMQGSGK